MMYSISGAEKAFVDDAVNVTIEQSGMTILVQMSISFLFPTNEYISPQIFSFNVQLYNPIPQINFSSDHKF